MNGQKCVKSKYSKFEAFVKDKGLTNKGVAKLIGKTAIQVNKILNSESDFSMADVRKICLTYGISSDEYFR